VGPTDPTVSLRPARADDPAEAEAVAGVHLRSRRSAPMPPSVHPPEDVRAFLAARLSATSPDETWVAEVDDVVVGYLRMTPTWVDDLYVDPAHAGQGVGTMLLDLAKALRPDGFGLWVFASNAPARAFYARHGLSEVERTDGAGNEEREPDVGLRWTP